MSPELELGVWPAAAVLVLRPSSSLVGECGDSQVFFLFRQVLFRIHHQVLLTLC